MKVRGGGCDGPWPRRGRSGRRFMVGRGLRQKEAALVGPTSAGDLGPREPRAQRPPWALAAIAGGFGEMLSSAPRAASSGQSRRGAESCRRRPDREICGCDPPFRAASGKGVAALVLTSWGQFRNEAKGGRPGRERRGQGRSRGGNQRKMTAASRSHVCSVVWGENRVRARTVRGRARSWPGRWRLRPAWDICNRARVGLEQVEGAGPKARPRRSVTSLQPANLEAAPFCRKVGGRVVLPNWGPVSTAAQLIASTGLWPHRHERRPADERRRGRGRINRGRSRPDRVRRFGKCSVRPPAAGPSERRRDVGRLGALSCSAIEGPALGGGRGHDDGEQVGPARAHY